MRIDDIILLDVPEAWLSLPPHRTEDLLWSKLMECLLEGRFRGIIQPISRVYDFNAVIIRNQNDLSAFKLRHFCLDCIETITAARSRIAEGQTVAICQFAYEEFGTAVQGDVLKRIDGDLNSSHSAVDMPLHDGTAST